MKQLAAWYMDDSVENPSLPHKLEPNEPVPLELLADLGVLYWHVLEPSETSPKLKEICAERGYTYNDVIECSPAKLPNFEEKTKMFFEEHIHSDEEIRFCLEGSGYFDVRDDKDRWIRIHVESGDLIIIPAGLYHRFALDTSAHIRAMRLFVGEPVWIPHNRPQLEHPARQQYLAFLAKAGKAVTRC
eukprot:TRINITY_DN88727_c0_g1_i1.p1 TRINITY_DN88727_c0_g1~~TRINITY_DN88727_c0_g1_i1.p1  ORF type:complete len:187 (-),score=32.47 TRINITY_DN88727_c0_g1_i1:36-596(-)